MVGLLVAGIKAEAKRSDVVARAGGGSLAAVCDNQQRGSVPYRSGHGFHLHKDTTLHGRLHPRSANHYSLFNAIGEVLMVFGLQAFKALLHLN